jgi:two-component sensor histidine kinase
MTTWELSAVASGSQSLAWAWASKRLQRSLVVHELATNSLKYGALSSPTGKLDIACAAHDAEVVVVWTERGGPAVASPIGEGGYGSKLLNRSMTTQLGGTISCDWSAEGVIVTLHMTKDRLAH